MKKKISFSIFLRRFKQFKLINYLSTLSRIDQLFIEKQFVYKAWNIVIKKFLENFITIKDSNSLSYTVPFVFKLIFLLNNQYIFKQIFSLGESVILSNQVAITTVAGGAGSRLNFAKPKGFFPITSISKKSLFALFAEKIKLYEFYYKVSLYWIIMINSKFFDEIHDFFVKNNFFNLKNIKLVIQEDFPILTKNGNFSLSNNLLIAKSANGHGGLLEVLIRNNWINILKHQGINILSYFQIDNALVLPIDPYFIGYHVLKNVDLSTKIVHRKNKKEKVGICIQNKKILQILEYSELNKISKKFENEKFIPSNTAIHLFSLNFLEKSFFYLDLPTYMVKKRMNIYTYNNFNKKSLILKFEKFIFDLMKGSSKNLLVEIDRLLEFAPLKNAKESDSLISFYLLQQRIFFSWLKIIDYPMFLLKFSKNIEITAAIGVEIKIFVKNWINIKYIPFPLNNKLLLIN